VLVGPSFTNHWLLCLLPPCHTANPRGVVAVTTLLLTETRRTSCEGNPSRRVHLCQTPSASLCSTPPLVPAHKVPSGARSMLLISRVLVKTASRCGEMNGVFGRVGRVKLLAQIRPVQHRLLMQEAAQRKRARRNFMAVLPHEWGAETRPLPTRISSLRQIDGDAGAIVRPVGQDVSHSRAVHDCVLST
jgi:hypothetical protein